MAIKSPAQVSQSSKLQILCLHGYLQNAEVTVHSQTLSWAGLRDTSVQRHRCTCRPSEPRLVRCARH